MVSLNKLLIITRLVRGVQKQIFALLAYFVVRQITITGMIGGMLRIETHKVIPFVLFIIVIAAFLFLPYFSQVELPVVQMSTFGSETVRAQVTAIIEEGEIDLGGAVQRYQIARVEILEEDHLKQKGWNENVQPSCFDLVILSRSRNGL